MSLISHTLKRDINNQIIQFDILGWKLCVANEIFGGVDKSNTTKTRSALGVPDELTYQFIEYSSYQSSIDASLYTTEGVDPTTVNEFRQRCIDIKDNKPVSTKAPDIDESKLTKSTIIIPDPVDNINSRPSHSIHQYQPPQIEAIRDIIKIISADDILSRSVMLTNLEWRWENNNWGVDKKHITHWGPGLTNAVKHQLGAQHSHYMNLPCIIGTRAAQRIGINSWDDLVEWCSKPNHVIGFVPAYFTLAVLDIDHGGRQSVDQAISQFGDPLAISTTRRSDGHHLIYPIANARSFAGDPIDNAYQFPHRFTLDGTTLAGEIGCARRYIIAWNPIKWHDAIKAVLESFDDGEILNELNPKSIIPYQSATHDEYNDDEYKSTHQILIRTNNERIIGARLVDLIRDPNLDVLSFSAHPDFEGGEWSGTGTSKFYACRCPFYNPPCGSCNTPSKSGKRIKIKAGGTKALIYCGPKGSMPPRKNMYEYFEFADRDQNIPPDGAQYKDWRNDPRYIYAIKTGKFYANIALIPKDEIIKTQVNKISNKKYYRMKPPRKSKFSLTK